MAFEKPVRPPFIQYSCIDHDFMIFRSGEESKWSNSEGKVLSRDVYEKKLPLMYTQQLVMNGSMPDSVNGLKINIQHASTFRSSFRVKPEEIHAPKPKLFPLFESQSGRANLNMPDDFFRITWRMEFIDAKTNKIHEEKSRMFSAVLYKRGFQFPAKSINGIPTTRKSCDEGYFVIDSADQLFHIKMQKGLPFVRQVELPEGMKLKTIQSVDFSDKLYYAYLFTENNQLFVLTQYDYLLERFDADNINPDKYEVRIYGDYFNFNVTTIGDGFIRTQVLNRDYKKVDEYSETWQTKTERTEGQIAQLLFPAQLKMTDSNSGYINFFVSTNKSFSWLIICFLLIITQFLIIRKRKKKIKTQLIDLLLIGICGIFGFIAVNVFPNKFID
ncbi:DUF4857 domain-containing protein [Draconibacterium halophilum]|uniref:DUF4857 domain-containing protein n=1 Tax=Draconibacterium halophilum TaxID=2706887 RepID=A0A6C0RBD0_9BACT|nr:DUF4857 domain-containing protein [Draconibacterium halophilum]QIA07948.1 DUF4857 domain-containing protein [Draconibacterium halophilum]